MQTRLETTLAKLIAIPSVTENAAACLEIIEYARRELAPLGLYVTSSKPGAAHPWFFATTQDTLEPDAVVAAHLDVVPGPENLFAMRRDDGKIYGRGVYDMKLAAVCYLEFFKVHADELRKLNIGILFSTDEEIGGNSMNDILATGLRPKAVFIPDGGDNWQIEARAKGFYGLKLEATGKNAHGSRPWEGDNALHRIMDVCQALRNEFISSDPDASTLAVTGIHGGGVINQIAGQASALIDFRSFEAGELARFKERVTELAGTHAVEIDFAYRGSPVIFDKNNEAIKGFLHAYSEILGQEPQYRESYGGSDARYFAEYQVPCIIVEPHGGFRHGNGEWLEANDLEKYYRLIEHWLLSTRTGASKQADKKVTVGA